jgi:Spy/CpxP family protein refolding chaperone
MTIVNRRMLWIIITALLLAASASAPSRRRGPPPGEGPSRWGVGSCWAFRSAPCLTRDQDRRVSETLSAYHASSATLVRQLRLAQSALADKLLAPGQLDAADLRPELQQVTRLRTELLELSARTMVGIRNVLTPSQIAEAAQCGRSS